MAKDEIVFDPRGALERERLSLAPRPETLQGLSLGVLDNTKWNAGRLLRETAALLEDECRFGRVNFYRKESFSKEADPSLLERIARENDVVLTAIGD